MPIQHTFQTHTADNITPGMKFTVSLGRPEVRRLTPRSTDTGLELIRLVASPEVFQSYLILGVIIDVVYHSGFRIVEARTEPVVNIETGEPTGQLVQRVHHTKKPLPGDNSILTAERITGPFQPFWIPRDCHIALHVKMVSEGPLFRTIAHFAPAK